jgi:hypothetical protein
VAHHDETGEGPVVAYMAPKMNAALDKLERYTGVRVPLEQVGSAHETLPDMASSAVLGSLSGTTLDFSKQHRAASWYESRSQQAAEQLRMCYTPRHSLCTSDQLQQGCKHVHRWIWQLQRSSRATAMALPLQLAPLGL